MKDPNVCLKTDFSTSKHLQDLLPPAAMDTDAPLESWNKSSEQDWNDMDMDEKWGIQLQKWKLIVDLIRFKCILLVS